MEQRPSSVTAKVLALLAAFTPDDPELTLSQLARRAGLTLPTAHRRVAELVEWGALERTSGGRYRVGLRLCEVASLAPRGLALRERALPFLEDLPTAHRQNVQLACARASSWSSSSGSPAGTRCRCSPASADGSPCTRPGSVWCCWLG
jgi:DNA-binding IclR family transcriptional regulator